MRCMDAGSVTRCPVSRAIRTEDLKLLQWCAMG